MELFLSARVEVPKQQGANYTQVPKWDSRWPRQNCKGGVRDKRCSRLREGSPWRGCVVSPMPPPVPGKQWGLVSLYTQEIQKTKAVPEAPSRHPAFTNMVSATCQPRGSKVHIFWRAGRATMPQNWPGMCQILRILLETWAESSTKEARGTIWHLRLRKEVSGTSFGEDGAPVLPTAIEDPWVPHWALPASLWQCCSPRTSLNPHLSSLLLLWTQRAGNHSYHWGRTKRRSIPWAPALLPAAAPSENEEKAHTWKTGHTNMKLSLLREPTWRGGVAGRDTEFSGRDQKPQNYPGSSGGVGEPATKEVCWGGERKKSELFCVDPEFWLLLSPELMQEPGGRESVHARTSECLLLFLEVI